MVFGEWFVGKGLLGRVEQLNLDDFVWLVFLCVFVVFLLCGCTRRFIKS